MIYFKSMATSLCSVALVALVSFLPEAQSSTSPYVIADDRVRSLDITPVLGRGYSVMTNAYHSTCLVVDETTVPSFNYDYAFHDFTNSEPAEVQADVAATFSYSFGYGWFKQKIKKDQAMANAADDSKSRYIASSMRIERYYSSIREEVSILNTDAITLLSRNDYVGFFKACGPTYIRGIRRAQEVTAFFLFTATSTTSAQKLSQKAKVQTWWVSPPTKTTEESSLRIVIKGWGLGLSQDGSEALVAKTLEDYDKVMKFAFRTMTVIPDAIHIGMVYGMEVLPWVHNTNFQVQANIVDEPIEIPLARSLIPKSYRINDPTDKVFDNTSDVTRAAFKCKSPGFEIDRYGFCCEAESLYNSLTNEYSEDNPNERVCRPVRQLSPSTVKDNMSANGEFVARLDSVVRNKMNQLSLLQRCISAAKGIPSRYDFHVLKSQDNVKYDTTLDLKFSVFELKLALDPNDDYAMVKHMSKELDEFLDMFIQPCYAAIFGSNIGNSPGTDPSYFMSYAWYTHRECTKLSCLGKSMRWDSRTTEGGCVSSMIAGAASPSFTPSSPGETSCKMDVIGTDLQCKYSSTDLNQHYEDTTNVWRQVLPTGRIDYWLDTFCLPSITGEKLNDAERIALVEAHEVATSASDVTEFSMNVSYKRPAEMSSTHNYRWNNIASYANDGDKKTIWGKDRIAATKSNHDAFWAVTLDKPERIKEVIVYPSNRLDHFTGITVELYYQGNLELEITPAGAVIDGKVVVDVSGHTNAPALVDYVKIVRKGRKDYLLLAEVEVMNIFEAPVDSQGSGGLDSFTLFPFKASYGNDIKNMRGDIDRIARECFSLSNCVGFTSSGYMKHTLKPSSTWVTWTSDPSKGFHIKNTLLTADRELPANLI